MGSLLGYQMKLISTKNFSSKVSAIDGGLMMGAVTFFLYNLVTTRPDAIAAEVAPEFAFKS